MNLKPYYRLPARGGTPTWVKLADSQNRRGAVVYKEYIYMAPFRKGSFEKFSKYNTKTQTHTYFGTRSHTNDSVNWCISTHGTLLNNYLYWGPETGRGVQPGRNKIYRVDPQTDTLTMVGQVNKLVSNLYFTIYAGRYLYAPNRVPTNTAMFMKYDTQTGTTTELFKYTGEGVSAHCIGKDGKWYTVAFGQGNNKLVEYDFSTDTYITETYNGIIKNNDLMSIRNMQLLPDGYIYLISNQETDKLTKIDTDTKTVIKLTIRYTGRGYFIYSKQTKNFVVAGQNQKCFLSPVINSQDQQLDPSGLWASMTVDSLGEIYGIGSNNELYKLEYQ